jgi:LPXTG-motif cell wall-anchored protein
MLATGVALGGLTGLTRADAQTVGDIYDPPGGLSGCRGNNVIVDTPYECEGARDYTVQGVSFTVRVEARFATDGTGTASYFLSRKLPQDVPIRVRSHTGISSASGPLVDDVSGVIPAGQKTAVLSFRFVCGQVDIKAVFTKEGDGRGRIMGPYVCTPPPPTVPTTAPTTDTVPTTSPTSSPGTGVTSAPQTSGTVSSSATLPATGLSNDGIAYAAVAVGLLGAVIIMLARRQPAEQ